MAANEEIFIVFNHKASGPVHGLIWYKANGAWNYLSNIVPSSDLAEFSQSRTISSALMVYSNTISTTNVGLSGTITTLKMNQLPVNYSPTY